jgi:hypothetical protein
MLRPYKNRGSHPEITKEGAIPFRDYIALKAGCDERSLSFSVSIPERDYIALKEREAEKLGVCSFQGAVARMT